MVPRQSLKSKDKEEPTRQVGPQVLWFSNLKNEVQREEFRQLMALTNGPVMKRLLDIVTQEITRTNNEQLRVSKYDSPSWPYLQADNVGYNRALRLVEELLKGIVK